eukprot:scaffold842_cov112-Isochrysis_galbana.AAC.4
MSKGCEGMIAKAKVRGGRTAYYEERSSKLERLGKNLDQERSKRFIYEEGFDPASKHESSGRQPRSDPAVAAALPRGPIG